MHPNAMVTLLPMQTNALDGEALPNGRSSVENTRVVVHAGGAS